MVTFKVQEMTVEAGRYLQPAMDQSKDKRMEMSTCWSQRQEVASIQDAEDVKK